MPTRSTAEADAFIVDQLMTSLAPKSTIGTPAVFLACWYFTRAPVARVVASLIGGGVFAVLNVACDVIGAREGWWSYPAYRDRGFGWPGWYVAVALGIAGIGLVGWRCHRHFGSRGLVAFLFAFALVGVTRDAVMSRTVAREIIVFGEGIAPWIADFAAWLILMGVAMAVQLAVRRDARDAHGAE